MKNPSGKILKVYEQEKSISNARDYWQNKTESIYFNQPDYFIGRILNSTIYSFLQRYLPTRGLILDGGCGSNYMAKLFNNSERKIIGLDFTALNLIKGKAYNQFADSVAGDLTKLPFADESFEAVLSISTAEHLEAGPQELFQETHRVIKTDGVFLLLMPTYNLEDYVVDFLKNLKKRTSKEKLTSIPHFGSPKVYKTIEKPVEETRNGFFAYWFNRKSILNLLRETGFKIERSFSLDVAGGLARSRIFHKFGKHLIEEIPLTKKKLSQDHLSWGQKFFLQEEIYQNQLKFWMHEGIGRFYRYFFAFVCRK